MGHRGSRWKYGALAVGGLALVVVPFLFPGERPDLENARVPLGPRPIILSLGEEHSRYAQAAARQLGGTALEAGVAGDGLARMLTAAERLVPEYRPDYLLVQYSPELVARAFGTSPYPYFYKDGTHVRIHPPIRLVGLMQSFGFVPKAAAVEDGVRYALDEIEDIAGQFGARIFIVVPTDGRPQPVPLPRDQFPPGSLVIEGHSDDLGEKVAAAIGQLPARVYRARLRASWK